MQLKTSFTVFGGYSVGVTPVPIPNTEVKSYRADDTAWETVWESRSLPKLFETPSSLLRWGGFVRAIVQNIIERGVLDGEKKAGEKKIKKEIDRMEVFR